MSTKKRSLCQMVVFVLAFLAFIGDTNAQSSQDDQEKALNMIADFADRICSHIPLEGTGQNVDLSVKAKADLKGLLKKIADIGIEGAGKYEDKKWRGVVQSDLKEILIKNADCKFKVFVSLIDKIKPSSQQTPQPIIKISTDLIDNKGENINKKQAPFNVRVKGNVSNANNFYTYLVVQDGNVQWIEPTANFGYNINGEFSGDYYLGEIDNPNSLHKPYKVFAVVTDKEYKEYEHLDRKTIKAQSNTIDLIRTR